MVEILKLKEKIMAKTYLNASKSIKDNELKLFIETYCKAHPGCTFNAATHPELNNVHGYKFTFPIHHSFFIFTGNLRKIVAYIIEIDEKHYHTWNSQSEMMVWFDLHKSSLA